MRTITRFGLVCLIAALPAGAKASQQPSERGAEKTWTGTLTAVDAKGHNLTGGHWWYHRTFNVGEHCAISTVDNKQAALSDLRPDERVRVRYQEAGGVLVADRIAEKPLHYRGTVHAVNEKTGTITMAEAALYRPFHAPEKFKVASDCKVILPNGQSVKLADVKPGDRITVMYELPGGSPVAYRIQNRSLTCVGTVVAVNDSARTLEAKGPAGEKNFKLAEDCRVIAKGKRGEDLNYVEPQQRYQFTYRTVNGINVLDRITTAPATSPSETASTR